MRVHRRALESMRTNWGHAEYDGGVDRDDQLAMTTTTYSLTMSSSACMRWCASPYRPAAHC